MSDPGAPPPPPPPPPDDAWRPPPPPPPPAPPGGAWSPDGGYGSSDPPPYAQAPPLGYGQQPPYGQPSPYGPPQYGGYPMTPPQTEGSAIGALIASILAWMFCPIIPAIVALVLIPGAKRKIDASGGRLTGEGLLTAAKWIAWINIALYGAVAVLIAIAVVIGAIADTSSTSSDFSLGAAFLP